MSPLTDCKIRGHRLGEFLQITKYRPPAREAANVSAISAATDRIEVMRLEQLGESVDHSYDLGFIHSAIQAAMSTGE